MLVYEGSESARDNSVNSSTNSYQLLKYEVPSISFQTFFVICVFIVEGSIGLSICLWVGEEMYFFGQLVFILISRNQGTCVWALSLCIKRIKKNNHSHTRIYIYIYIYIYNIYIYTWRNQ